MNFRHTIYFFGSRSNYVFFFRWGAAPRGQIVAVFPEERLDESTPYFAADRSDEAGRRYNVYLTDQT